MSKAGEIEIDKRMTDSMSEVEILRAKVKELELQVETIKRQQESAEFKNFQDQISAATKTSSYDDNLTSDAITKSRVNKNGDIEYLHLSKHCKKLFELEENENTPEQVFKKIFPEDLSVLMGLIENASKTLEFVTKEIRIATKSNPEKWLKLILKPELDADGNVILNSFFTDITDLRATALKQKLMSMIVTHSTNLFLITNAQGEIEWVNRYFEKLTGYTLEEAVGKKPGALLQGPNTDANQVRLISKHLKECKPFFGEILNYSKKGKPYWLWLEIQPVFDESNELSKFVAIQTDITQSKLNEKALVQNEAKFRLIAENIQDGIFILDSNQKIIYASDNFYAQMDFEKDDNLTDLFPRLLDMVHPDEKALINENVVKAFASKAKNLNSHFRTFTNKGRLIWREDFASVTYDAKGNLDKVYVVCRDITDRKEKEHQLALRANMLSNVGQGVLATDSNGFITYWNKQTAQIFEWEDVDVKGLLIVDFIQNKEFKEVAKSILDQLKQGESFDAELMIPTKSQRLIPTSITVRSMHNSENQIIGFVAILEDITARKQAEKEIKKLSQAIEQGNSIAVITDLNGIIEYVNPRFTEVTGYSFEEALGKNPSILKSGQTTLETYRDMWDTLNRGEVWKGEFLNKKKNGQLFWESAIMSPITNENNEIINYVAIKEDITVKKQNENELMLALETVNLQNNRLLDFTYIISHNLRSHAANFHGLIQLIKQTETMEEVTSYIDLMDVASVNLLDTLKHLNEIITIQKSTNLELKPISIHAQIELICNSLVFDLHEYGIRLYNNVQHDTVVYANVAYFESIVLNLITNAIKYRDRNRTPKIEITSYPVKDNKVIIEVKDNGIGIDLEKNAEKLFKMYQTFSGLPDSKGLGLYIVKNQVNAMGGEITVESQTGVGTTFKVVLPIS